MATSTSITTTYAGEFAGEYISAALLSGATIEGGGITVKPNVKFKEVIKKVDTNAIAVPLLLSKNSEPVLVTSSV